MIRHEPLRDLSLAEDSGLILTARVGKHPDTLLEELLATTEGKTTCQQWNTDDWDGYKRILTAEIEHHIGKGETQRIERTNGIIRQQTGRWHRKQNKFGKLWEQTKVTTRLVVIPFLSEVALQGSLEPGQILDLVPCCNIKMV